MESGWLLEKHENGTILWIGVIDGLFQWTEYSTLALRLARREDGDKLAEIIEDADSITEHTWG